LIQESLDLSPAMCRDARGLVSISQERLAAESGVSQRAINSFEVGRTRMMAANREAIRTVLEAAGVEFLDNGAVRLSPISGKL
jgi:hypothetical protein